MAKRHVFVATTLLLLLSFGVADAKVCRTGDPSCTALQLFGDTNTSCDLGVYHECSVPRVGAAHCLVDNGGVKEAFYKNEDCCSHSMYVPCDANENEVGVGKSCYGVDGNTTYSGCACAYGYGNSSDPNDDSGFELKVDPEPDYDINAFVRCAYIDGKSHPDEPDGTECKAVYCNQKNHYVSYSTDAGDGYTGDEKNVCVYRNKSFCGAFECWQVEDCNNAKGWYRNDSKHLDEGGTLLNLIGPFADDRLSDEKLFLDVTNRYVCKYDQSDKSGLDTYNGVGCGLTMPNFCYKLEGCNTDRRWFREVGANVGVQYNGHLYDEWFDKVEKHLKDMINAYGNQNKADEIYLIYINDIKDLIISYESFLKTNQLYWYKDNYYKNEAKLQDFKRNYKTLIRIYDESNFRQLRDWVYPSSFR